MDSYKNDKLYADIKFNKPKKKKRLSLGKIIKFIFVIFICIYFANAFKTQQRTLNNLNIAKERQIHKKDELAMEIQDIKREIDMIDSEKHIEGAARKRLNLIKPGEIVFIDILKQDRFSRDR